MNHKTLVLLAVMLLLYIAPVSATVILDMIAGDFYLAIWKLMSVYWLLVALSYYEKLEEKCNNT